MSRTGYQHLVHDYYIERLRAISSQRRERLSNMRTRTQALHYQKNPPCHPARLLAASGAQPTQCPHHRRDIVPPSPH